MNYIQQAIEEYGILDAMDGVPGMECDGSAFHSPTPLATVSVNMADLFGPLSAEGEDTISLCPTCLANLRVFVLLMTASTGTLPWKCRRQFGNLIRELGTRAYESYYKEQVRDGAAR